MSKSVSGTWTPAPRAAPALDTLRAWAAAMQSDEDGFLSAFTEQAPTHAGLMQLDADVWAEPARALSDDQLTALVRFFTLAEARFSGWEAGERSPVIPLAAELRARGAFPVELKRWVRAVSRNRFLPHGSLQTRL